MGWTIFLIAYLYGALLLYVPGYICARTFGIRGGWALSIAPLLTSGVMSLVGEVAYRAHIPLTPTKLTAVTLLVIVAAFALQKLVVQTYKLETPRIKLPAMPALLPLAYVACGITATLFLFISSLESPNNVNPAWDMANHFNATRAMVNDGIFSSFHISSYLTSEMPYIPWEGNSAVVYPATWNMLYASIGSVINLNFAIASNALNTVSCSLVFPLSMMGFIASMAHMITEHTGTKHMGMEHTTTKQETSSRFMEQLICWSGALISCLFIIFPWSCLVFGPLFPYILGLSLAPALCWLFIQYALTKNQYVWHMRLRLFVLLICCILSLVLIHPSTLFSCVLFVIPWYIQALWTGSVQWSLPRISRKHSPKKPARFIPRQLAASIFTLFCGALWFTAWFFLIKKGPLRAFYWGAYADAWQAVRSILGMNFVPELPKYLLQVPQPALSLLVFLGLWIAVRKIKCQWLAFSWVASACMCYYVTATDLVGKRFLTGFWYTDYQRVGANSGVLSILLASVGMAYLIFAVAKLIARMQEKHEKNASLDITTPNDELNTMASTAPAAATNTTPLLSKGALACSTAAVACLVVLGALTLRFPSEYYHQAAPQVYKAMCHYTYTAGEVSSKEQAFLKQAANIINARGRAGVANNPYDGSFIAYGLADLPCVYRHPVTFEDEREQTRIIREKLVHYQVHPEVIEALKQTGIRYVLQLEDPGFIPFSQNYHKPDYAGIDHISDRTPGFKVLAADGDMRLYEITDIH
ncbi:DUF6541 family protein [Atopobium deltae]|uniref:Uncharacterized protein n=1 Tax=Atopobium deltae TaxID=1393034 RepID=A0A133XX69_9ACTN|nr:DUF6541 family protein [Atopobium deltae]KXB35552.1 hypothetical protein HMPREF3192_00203 [Atopobium deltae]